MNARATERARAWVASREPAPPAALAERVAIALGACGSVDSAPESEIMCVAETCLAAAESLLARVLEDAGAGRAAALDLLAADALVTYAFEAASDEPTLLPSLARAAMARLSRMAVATAP